MRSNARNAPRRAQREASMSDLVYAGLSVAFFALAAAYVLFCDKVR